MHTEKYCLPLMKEEILPKEGQILLVEEVHGHPAEIRKAFV